MNARHFVSALVLLALLPFSAHALNCSTAAAGTAKTSAQLTANMADNGAPGNITPGCYRDMVASSFTTTPATASAAGTTQGTATVLTGENNIITTVAAGAGVVAPVLPFQKIWNDGVNALLIYPTGTAQFEATGAAIPFSLAAGGWVEIGYTSTTQAYLRSSSNPALPTATFTISNNQIVDPTGAPFRAYGINIWGCSEGPTSNHQNAATGGATLSAQLRSLFPGLNFIRIAQKQACDSPAGLWGGYAPSQYDSFVNDATANKIMVEFEDHETSHRILSPITSPTLAQEAAWYAALASHYKSNPYVSFGSENEPGYPAPAWTTSHGYVAGNLANTAAGNFYTETVASCTSLGTGAGPTGTGTAISDNNCSWNFVGTGTGGELTQMQAEYTAIRTTAGSNALFFLQSGQNAGDSLDSLYSCNTGWCNQGAPSSPVLTAVAGWHNVVWEMHDYGGVGASLALVNAYYLGAFGAAEYQLATSQDGLVPVFAGEGGNSSNGSTQDANAALQQQSNYTNTGAGWAGAALWQFEGSSYNDILVMITAAYTLPATPTLSAYGLNIACYIARNTTGCPAP